jgi:hypothetical protein
LTSAFLGSIAPNGPFRLYHLLRGILSIPSGDDMETLGLVTVLVVGAGALAAAAVVVMSMPDINRYRRLKKM